MILSEYIKQLQELKDKCGDVKVKLNKTYECYDLSINDTYEDPEDPYYDKGQNYVIIYSDFIGYV